MEESKLEKISDYLCAIGVIMCVGAMIGGIIYVILCGLGGGLIRAFVIYVAGTLIIASSGIVLQVDISKSKKEIIEKEREQEDVDNSWYQVSEYEQENLVTGEIRLGRTERTEEDDMEKFETKIDGYWAGTIGYEVKRLFDLDIGEKFVLKSETFDRNCFINKDGIVLFESFIREYGALEYRALKYGEINVDYKMLKMFIDQCGYSIEKLPQTIDKQVIRDYIKELESEIKEVDRLNNSLHFSLNLAVQKSLKRIVYELKELLKKGD